MKLIASILCILVAGFCGFGFLASMEPGVSNAFKLGYGITGLACVAVIVGLAIKSVRSRRR